MTDKNPLIGKTITAIKIADDKTALLFITTDGDVVAETYGDCCSNSWVEHVELPTKLPALVTAADWIYKNVDNIAYAKSYRVKTEEMMRVIKSEVILRTEGTAAHKEATALASQEYRNAIDEYATAIREESQLTTKLKAAEVKIEVWRSQSANQRGRI